MIWQDVFCWFGFHRGKWGSLNKTTVWDSSDPKGKHPIERQHHQIKECPNCGMVSIRDAGTT